MHCYDSYCHRRAQKLAKCSKSCGPRGKLIVCSHLFYIVNTTVFCLDLMTNGLVEEIS